MTSILVLKTMPLLRFEDKSCTSHTQSVVTKIKKKDSNVEGKCLFMSGFFFSLLPHNEMTFLMSYRVADI